MAIDINKYVKLISLHQCNFVDYNLDHRGLFYILYFINPFRIINK